MITKGDNFIEIYTDKYINEILNKNTNIGKYVNYYKKCLN